MAKETYVRTLEPYFVKRTEEPFWSYSHPQNLLQNGDFEAWTAGSGVGDEPDGWTESGVGDVQREAATVKRCTYSAELTHPGGAGGSTLYQSASCPQFYRGLYVSLSAWVYADDAGRVRLSIADGVTSTYSEYHPGDGAWWLLTVVKLIDGAANQVTMAFRIEVGVGAVTAWIDAAHLCLGPVPRAYACKPICDDGTVTIEKGVITKNVEVGDPRQVYSIGGVAKAVTGVDDDDGDKLKIATGTNVLGTAADVLIIDPATKYIGVWATNPAAKFHIYGTDASDPEWLLGNKHTDDLDGYGVRCKMDMDAGHAYWDIHTKAGGAGNLFVFRGGHGGAERGYTRNIIALDTSNGNVGINVSALLAKLHVDQASTTAAIPVLLLDQADDSEGFVNFVGNSAASVVGPISTWSVGNAIQGFYRIEINGVQYWAPYYNAPTGS